MQMFMWQEDMFVGGMPHLCLREAPCHFAPGRRGP